VILLYSGGMEATHKLEASVPALELGSVAALDSVRISGFRSLVEFEQVNLPTAFVLDSANGSGKTNLIRF